MLKWKDFCFGGYNFDNWSLVKELYVPTDISSSTDRSLHVRGREGLPGSPNNSNPALRHHLQHYVIPYGKVFIAFAMTNVKMTTQAGMGLVGTGKAYGRYPTSHQQPGDVTPGAPFAWVIGGSYYYNGSTWGTLVLHGGRVYECCQSHTGSVDKEPPNVTYWTPGALWAEEWESGKFYFFNQLAVVTVEGYTGAYMCMVDHTSALSNKPCSGADWDYGEVGGIWNPGDEYQADLSSQFGFAESCLNVSKGVTKAFGKDIVAVFTRSTENRLRRIDAKTDSGTMKAGATLLGIEVDA